MNEKAIKARKLRYKKSIAQGFNIADIEQELNDLQGDMEDVRYFADGDIDELVEALDGDEEEAYEFRMMFAELSGEAEILSDLIYDYNRQEDLELFDVFFAAVSGGAVQLLGYDSYEDDYYAMSTFEQELGESEAEKRLLRMTKKDIISAARHCFGIACAFLNLRYKGEYLKAAMDVLKGENHAYLEAVKGVEKLYEAAEADGWDEFSQSVKKLDKALDALPERVWVE